MNTNKEDVIIQRSLWFLIATAFLSGITIEIEKININLSQVIAISLLFFLIVYHAINQRQIAVIFVDVPSLLLYLYLIVNLFSSIFFSPVMERSLKGCVLIFSYVFTYCIARWALKFILDQRLVVKKLMNYNMISAFFGLSCMAISLYAGGYQNIGVTFDQLGAARIPSVDSPLPSIKSLSVEPNVFAIITAVVLCVNLALYMRWQKSRKQLMAIAILSIGILFAYTRSVYVSLALALCIIIILSNRIKILMSIFNYFILVSVMFAVLMFFLPDDNNIKNALVSRASTLLDFRHGSGEGRLIGLRIAWDGLKENPGFGNGTLSAYTTIYNPYKDIYQERMGSPGWLNGVLIQSMHDTGVVGVIIILSLFASIIIANYRMFKKLRTHQIEKSIVLGFISGNVILFVASQTSSALWISFPYIYWAINLAFLTWSKQQIEPGGNLRSDKTLSKIQTSAE